MKALKHLKLLGLFAIIIWTMTGCVKTEIGLNLKDDGSGEYVEQVLVAKTGLEQSGLGENYLNEAMSDLDTTDVLVEDVTTKIDGIEYVGKKLSFDFKNFDDLQDTLLKVFKRAQNEPENTNDSVNHIADYITHEKKVYRLDMPAETLFVGDVGDSKYNYTVDATFFIDLCDDDISIKASNADTINGTRHEWRLTNRNSNIQLEIELPKAGQEPSILVIILAVVLLVILLGIAFKPQKPKEEKAENTEDTATETTESEIEKESTAEGEDAEAVEESAEPEQNSDEEL